MIGRNGRIIDATKLREACDENVLSLSDLADKAGVSYRTIKYAASAATPRIHSAAIVKAIAAALGLEADDISRLVGADTADATDRLAG